MTIEAAVRAFRAESGQPTPTRLDLDGPQRDAALALLDSAMDDFHAALFGADEVQAVTEYGHLLFVVMNLAVALGIPGYEAFLAVLDSNRTKLIDPKFSDDGRLMKGEHFKPAEPTVRRMLVERGDVK